jgi:hypothetical protein
LLADIPQITFGRYTGDTPETEEDARPEVLQQVLRPNERFTRSEIRADPPHILLTNFAMLEYLLLRPKDDALFKQQRLRFIVLDEAHSYTGAQGIDVGLLMRRLKQAFPGKKHQFVLTSATIGDADDKILGFATRLTGAAFSRRSILRGSAVTQFDSISLRPAISLERYTEALPNDAEIAHWMEALDDAPMLARLIETSGLGTIACSTIVSPPGLLWKWLAANRELALLHALLDKGPRPLSVLCGELWGTASVEAQRATRWLLTLGARARKDPTSAPLVPARFHFFFRGLRGATVCLSTECRSGGDGQRNAWSQLILEDRSTCPECGAHCLPLLTCVHCGTPYLRVYAGADGGWQAQPSLAGGQTAHVLLWSRELGSEEENDELYQQIGDITLCLSCRALFEDGSIKVCCSSPNQVTLREVISNGDGNLAKCPCCGGLSGGFDSVLRGFSTGEDAASAVLAESIIRAMPSEDIQRPANGRRLLAFSDSRQRAAHFAPYLSRTAAETQYLKPVVDAIMDLSGDSHEDVPLLEVANRFLNEVTKQPFIVLRKTLEGDGESTVQIKPPKQLYRQEKEALRRECVISLLQSFTQTLRAKNTLTAFGIATMAVELNEHQSEEMHRALPELFSLGNSKAFAVIQHLLRVIVRRRAFSFPLDITLDHIQPSGGPQCYVMHYSLADRLEGRQRVRWNAYEATLTKVTVPRSPQVHIIAQALGCDLWGGAHRITSVLRRAWDVLCDTGVLEQWGANEYVLPHQQLLIRTRGPWFVCNRCGLVLTDYFSDRCLSPACGGELKEAGAGDFRNRFCNHHQFYRTTRMEPLPLAVREHTAQLTTDRGQQYQNEFVSGLVNVLSSSTTFEMGVDVGQLKTVFLRNVPPTAANYIQRAGRAGRRKEGTAFAVTYARAFPHDQTHYHDPVEIVAGTVGAPQINLANRRLTQRHVNSYLLGRFLLSYPGEITTAEGLFEGARSVVEGFCAWTAANRPALVTALGGIIPKECDLEAHVAVEESGQLLREIQNAYSAKLAGIFDQIQELLVQIRAALDAAGSIDKRSGALQSHLQKLAEQLKKTRLIDYLSGEHWLPSYAFPQDVVRLQVRDPKVANRLRLERDAEYGIAEYAPGAEVVADGFLIRSCGIDKQGRELSVESYRACSVCNNVQFADNIASLIGPCTTCGSPPMSAASRARHYVIPPGFTTDINEKTEEVRFGRVRVASPSKIFLISGAYEDSFAAHPDVWGVRTGYRQDGELFRACAGKRGAPFRLCLVCGRALGRDQKAKHDKPWGVSCPNERFSNVDLAYRFRTDTLQVRFDAGAASPPPVTDSGFWLSFQTAFVSAAAEVLAIPLRDIEGTYRTQASPDSRVELVIFDRVPGGAGYVQRVRDQMYIILNETLARVKQCRNPHCDPRGSCYCCLRTYYNQFQWELLKRDAVSGWLEAFLACART